MNFAALQPFDWCKSEKRVECTQYVVLGSPNAIRQAYGKQEGEEGEKKEKGRKTSGGEREMQTQERE